MSSVGHQSSISILNKVKTAGSFSSIYFEVGSGHDWATLRGHFWWKDGDRRKFRGELTHCGFCDAFEPPGFSIWSNLSGGFAQSTLSTGVSKEWAGRNSRMRSLVRGLVSLPGSNVLSVCKKFVLEHLTGRLTAHLAWSFLWVVKPRSLNWCTYFCVLPLIWTASDKICKEARDYALGVFICG